MVRFDTPAFPNLYRTRPLGIRPRTAYYLWFELTAMCDDWAMALDGQQFFVQTLVDTLPRVAQLHADEEFIQRLVEAARDLRNRVATATFPDRRLATCTAQEFIIHIALDRLEDDLDEMRNVIHFDGFHKMFPKTRYDRRCRPLPRRAPRRLRRRVSVRSGARWRRATSSSHCNSTRSTSTQSNGSSRSHPARTDEHLASRSCATALRRPSTREEALTHPVTTPTNTLPTIVRTAQLWRTTRTSANDGRLERLAASVDPADGMQDHAEFAIGQLDHPLDLHGNAPNAARSSSKRCRLEAARQRGSRRSVDARHGNGPDWR